MPAHKGHDLVSFQYSFVTKSPCNHTAQVRRQVSDATEAHWVISHDRMYITTVEGRKRGMHALRMHEILLASRYMKDMSWQS